MQKYTAQLVLIQEINLGAIEYYRALINAYGKKVDPKSIICPAGVNKAKIDDKFADSVKEPLEKDYAGNWEEFKKHLFNGLELIEKSGIEEGKTEVVLVDNIEDKEMADLNLETANARVSGYMEPFDNTFGKYSVYIKEVSVS